MSDDVLLRVQNLSKRYCKDRKRSLRYAVKDTAAELSFWKAPKPPLLRPDEFWALEDICLELRPGESLGIVGRNGAGKSTLLKLLTGLIKPDAGSIAVRGRVGALIELGAGFNPVLTGRENILLNAAMLGLSRHDAEMIVEDVIEFSGIHDFIESPVRNYSSGMWARLGYAVAANLKPDLLLVDEVLAVGDLAFQRKCLRHMHQYLEAGGALVFVSHDPYAVQTACRRGLLIENGKGTFAGTAVDTLERYFRTLDWQEGAAAGGDSTESPVRLRKESDLDEGAALVTLDRQPAQDRDQMKAAETEPVPRAAVNTAFDDTPCVPPNPETSIAIAGLSISPAEGREIRAGGDVRITLRYSCTREISPVFWAFAIYTRDHQACVSGNVDGFAEGICRATPGGGVFSARIRNLPLVAGTYVLKAVIGDPVTGGQYARWGWENPATRFEVHDSISVVNNFYAMAGCLIKLDVEWNSKENDSSAEAI